MEELTNRAIRLNALIIERRYKTIEVHPTSTQKALKRPIRPRREVQASSTKIGLKGTWMRALSVHEIDAAIAALTAHLHLRGKTESVSAKQEGVHSRA